MNSFDTWHGKYLIIIFVMLYDKAQIHLGTKNVARELKKVCQGTARTEGKTWFRQLNDKSELRVCVHVHFSVCLIHYALMHT